MIMKKRFCFELNLLVPLYEVYILKPLYSTYSQHPLDI